MGEVAQTVLAKPKPKLTHISVRISPIFGWNDILQYEYRISDDVFIKMRFDETNLSRSVLIPDRPNSIKIKSCLLPLYFHLSK